ncbi:hypothetical protein L228DRAFT_261884 [Xylona heveae TC161]|uniref:REJ domain-containing protein n=1 Tax=Xylona heveae (strain CBS 132557 / TC161) TaxID=1328760 RepID=A0A165G575_XYLHT|nr:hypothetical protein L228DRAFT_261884 [Xylona heveae TC161]KZF21751.1 hypothetical protein L228DRAFT_261884 [Xylona heveae TC161]
MKGQIIGSAILLALDAVAAGPLRHPNAHRYARSAIFPNHTTISTATFMTSSTQLPSDISQFSTSASTPSIQASEGSSPSSALSSNNDSPSSTSPISSIPSEEVLAAAAGTSIIPLVPLMVTSTVDAVTFYQNGKPVATKLATTLSFTSFSEAVQTASLSFSTAPASTETSTGSLSSALAAASTTSEEGTSSAATSSYGAQDFSSSSPLSSSTEATKLGNSSVLASSTIIPHATSHLSSTVKPGTFTSEVTSSKQPQSWTRQWTFHSDISATASSSSSTQSSSISGPSAAGSVLTTQTPQVVSSTSRTDADQLFGSSVPSSAFPAATTTISLDSTSHATVIVYPSTSPGALPALQTSSETPAIGDSTSASAIIAPSGFSGSPTTSGYSQSTSSDAVEGIISKSLFLLSSASTLTNHAEPVQTLAPTTIIPGITIVPLVPAGEIFTVTQTVTETVTATVHH